MAHDKREQDTIYCPETGIFSGTWHNEHENVIGRIAMDGSNIPNVFAPIVESNFKLETDFGPLSAAVGEDGEKPENPLENWKMVLADLRGINKGVIPLHVPKKDYQIHQNKSLFDSMVKAATQVLGNGFEIATVGTLGGYGNFFMSIAIKGEFEGWTVGEKDAWKSFFNLVSSHNGQVASQTLLSLIRIVCMNTVQASIADAANSGQNAKIKHTANSVALITPQVFEANLRRWVTERAQTIKTLEMLKGEKMSLDGFRSFAAGVHSNQSTDILSTNAFNRIGQLTELFTRGKGNSGETRYDALNAFTEFYTSGNGVGNPANVKTSKRLASASFGQGNTWKQTALSILGDSQEFDKVTSRGAILYGDKLKEMATAN